MTMNEPSLTELLDSISACQACWLMEENTSKGICYVPILPKPEAHFMFIGRDPSPRTATKVGVRGGKSVFINEIFKIADEARVSEDRIYITDLCKCHWRTSAGAPLPETEQRSYITNPVPPPAKLSAKADKSVLDAVLVC